MARNKGEKQTNDLRKQQISTLPLPPSTYYSNEDRRIYTNIHKTIIYYSPTLSCSVSTSVDLFFFFFLRLFELCSSFHSITIANVGGLVGSSSSSSSNTSGGWYWSERAVAAVGMRFRAKMQYYTGARARPWTCGGRSGNKGSRSDEERRRRRWRSSGG